MRGAMIRNTRAVVALKLPRRHAVTIKVDGHPGEVGAYADLVAAARRLAAGTGAGERFWDAFTSLASCPAQVGGRNVRLLRIAARGDGHLTLD